jgi:hypothetical protein
VFSTNIKEKKRMTTKEMQEEEKIQLIRHQTK